MSFLFLLLLLMNFQNFFDFVSLERLLCRCEEFPFEGRPFVALWNSPTIGCDFNFSIPIHLKKYGILENDRQTWDGKRVTLFSSAQLGLYPYFVMNGQQNFNGGLPQLVDLNQHLRKARLDIINKIPDPDFDGVAVIDWEPWRPLWDTNWNKKRIYKVRSLELVRSKHPDWPLYRLLETAKKEFEDSGRAMFEHTITLGKQLRPKALWGFYGFPDCFAHVKNRYQCTPEVMKQNDKLEWLFSASTALFPSMYLLDQHPDNQDYVLGRLRETLRFASRGVGQNKRKVPIFVYHRNIYENSPHDFNFLTTADLENTIGSAADIGAAGIIIWGNRFDENTSPEVCRRIDKYVADTLGPFLQRKTKQVESCASSHCGNQGYCIRRTLLNDHLTKLLSQHQIEDHCATENVAMTTSNMARIHHENGTTTRNNTHRTHADTFKTHTNTRPKFHGYSFDLGTELAEGHYVNHSAMDDFFQLLNGTKRPTERDKPDVKKRNKPSERDLRHYRPNTLQTTRKHINQNSKSLGSILEEQTPRSGNSNHTSNEKLRNAYAKEGDIKKSNIPHPGMRQNIVMDQTRSEIVHRLLSSVHGNLISTSQLLNRRKNGASKTELSRRKSEIVKAPADSHAPVMASVKRNQRSWLPHMYIILIGVSLGGALLFSLVFVAVYYYISLQNTFSTRKKERKLDLNETDKSLPPQAHSSPKFTENDSFKEQLNSENSQEQKRTPLYSHQSPEKLKATKLSGNSNRRVRSVERRADQEHDRRVRAHSESRERRHRSRSRDSRKSSNDSRGSRHSNYLSRSHSESRGDKKKRETQRYFSREEADEVEVNVNDLR